MARTSSRLLAIVCAGAAVAACDWDKYDPRLVSPSSSAGAGGMGGAHATGGAAGTATGGGAPLECGGVDVLGADGFDDAARAFQWDVLSSGNGTVVEENGELVMTTASTATKGYVSRFFHDFRKSEVSVAVTAVPDPSLAPTAATELAVQRFGDSRVLFRQQGGELHAIKRVAATDTALVSVPYDPVSHRYWKLRHDVDRILWEVSRDGIIWNPFAEHPLSGLFDFQWTRVVMQLVADDLSEARFDEFHSDGPGEGRWCPPAALHDDFSDGKRGDQWLFSEGDGNTTALEYQGHLVITPPPNKVGAFFNYISSQLYRLDDAAAVWFEVVEPPQPEASLYLALNGEGEQLAMTLHRDTTTGKDVLDCTYSDATTTTSVNAPVFLIGLHRWWRIRVADDTAYWEASGDGIDWGRPLGSQFPAPIALDAVQILIGSSTPTGLMAPEQVLLDNVNLP